MKVKSGRLQFFFRFKETFSAIFDFYHHYHDLFYHHNLYRNYHHHCYSHERYPFYYCFFRSPLSFPSILFSLSLFHFSFFLTYRNAFAQQDGYESQKRYKSPPPPSPRLGKRKRKNGWREERNQNQNFLSHRKAILYSNSIWSNTHTHTHLQHVKFHYKISRIDNHC